MTSDLKYCSNYNNNNVLINEHSPDRQWSLDWKCKHYLFCTNLLITMVKTKDKKIYINVQLTSIITLGRLSDGNGTSLMRLDMYLCARTGKSTIQYNGWTECYTSQWEVQYQVTMKYDTDLTRKL